MSVDKVGSMVRENVLADAFVHERRPEKMEPNKIDVSKSQQLCIELR